MGDTPKNSKSRGRCSLSLKRRHTKRPPSEPKCLEETDHKIKPQGSPCTSSKAPPNDFILETPPHKKISLDDNFDSNSSFDEHSPTAFLSQRLGAESPDVYWIWSKEDIERMNAAYLVDKKLLRAKIEKSREAYWEKRDKRRRAKEVKLRKAERARVEASLRERIAGLEAQMNAEKAVKKLLENTKQIEGTIGTIEAQLNAKKTVEKPLEDTKPIEKKQEDFPKEQLMDFDDFGNIFDESNLDFSQKPENTKQKDSLDGFFNNSDIDIFDDSNLAFSHKAENKQQKDSLDDFFNDSDTDCLLVQTTQELEATVPELTQTLGQKQKFDAQVSSVEQMHNNKCSSLYMKFLEDDEDDFFVSLDDSFLQKATQSINPRSPFQRYKSMPSSTTDTLSSASLASSSRMIDENLRDNKSTNLKCNNKNTINTISSSSPSNSVKTIKRHASSHAMTSSSSTNYRGRQLPSRR